MMSSSRVVLLCLFAASTFLTPRPAAGAPFRYFETVDVARRDAADFELDYDGDVTGGDDSTELGDILAQLSGPRFRGAAAVDRFGNVGLLAELLPPSEFGLDFHKLRSRTSIAASPVFLNTFPYPVHLFANFVLDGGELRLVAGDPMSFARYELTLNSASTGDVFFTSGVLTPGSFTRVGADIGATYDNHFTVDIPLSFQEVDLGIVDPGQQVYLAYYLEVEVGMRLGDEIGHANFSDPFHLSHNSLLGTLRTVPAAAAAPEPAMITLMGAGVLALLRNARRRRRWQEGSDSRRSLSA